jgi:RHS repeat-associated protein
VDNLGSVTAITDPAGVVLERRVYDPFGKMRAGSATAPLLEKDGYTGQEEDDELGLVNMNGRTYDPVIAKFLSADPMVAHPKSTQGWNPYAYVRNNPLRLIDPSGYQDTSTSNSGDGIETYNGETATVVMVTSYSYLSASGATSTGEFVDAWTVWGARGGAAAGGSFYLPSTGPTSPDAPFYMDELTALVLKGSAAHDTFVNSPAPTAAPATTDTSSDKAPLPSGGNPLVGAGKELWNQTISVVQLTTYWHQLSSPSAWDAGPEVRANLESQKFAIENKGEGVGQLAVIAGIFLVGPEDMAAEGTWAAKALESGATRRIATMGDTQFRTGADALAEALERHGIDPSTVEVTPMYGKNPNLIGPRGQPWETVRGLNSEGKIIEFQHHPSGHFFGDTNEFELPHYHGPDREHLTY